MLANLTTEPLAILTVQLQLCLFLHWLESWQFRRIWKHWSTCKLSGAEKSVRPSGTGSWEHPFKAVWLGHWEPSMAYRPHLSKETQCVKALTRTIMPVNSFSLFCFRKKEAKHNEINQYLVSSDLEFNILQLITLTTIHSDPMAQQSHQS